jgi:hypothetical protein
MSVFSLGQANAIQVGNAAGWVLEFYTVDSDGTIADTPTASLRSADYYAEIDATLQDGLQGGSYTITVEGLTDTDYQTISQGQNGRPIVAKLYLFWNDTISGPASYLTNLGGLSSGPSPDDLKEALVATLYVATPKRRLGALTYNTELHAVEWAFHMMSQPLQKPLQADFYTSVCLDISDRTQVPINTFPESGRLTTDAAGTTSTEKVNYPTGKTYGAVLTEIASALEKNLNKYGRNMVLIRDGQIYLGPRSFPLEGDPKDLTVATGLLEAFRDGSSAQDPTAPDLSGGSQRPHFTLTLKGRADLKPGDVVRFDASPEDDTTTTPGLGAALAGAVMGPILPDLGGGLSDNPKVMAVSSVKHRLGKSAGFSTEVKGVVLADPSDPWDAYANSGASPKPKPPSPTADPAANAASAIKEHLEDWTSNFSHLDVGQVRAVRSRTSGSDAPSQTETAWEGLQEVDGNPNGTRRLPVDRDNAVRMDIPYASPFAWGKCGLVLPRYPGMRVALGHRRGLDHEAIDMGAIWDSGTGPDSEPGDWWLSLPVGADPATSSADDSAAPAPWSKDVSQDLIDSDGNRMIELGSLVVRIGRNSLQDAGTRPRPPDEPDSITIEHADGGSAIVMRQDGSILIQGTSIEIDAGSGNVTIKAKQVDIQ